MPYRTWLITGVSSGFGYELCRQLLEKGDKVIGTVRDKNKVANLIATYTDTFDCEILDVTSDYETQTELAASTDFPVGE